MAALLPSGRAGRTDSQTTCFGEFVWKPAAVQPEGGKLWEEKGEANKKRRGGFLRYLPHDQQEEALT